MSKLKKTRKNGTRKTIHYGRNIQLFFYISDILLFFHKYMKNKIGILENDIYIFPIVISVNSLLVHSFDGLVHLIPTLRTHVRVRTLHHTKYFVLRV